MNLLAQYQFGDIRTWGFGNWIIAFVVLGGCIAIAAIAFRRMGWQPPSWIIEIIVVCLVVVVAVAAIRFVLTV